MGASWGASGWGLWKVGPLGPLGSFYPKRSGGTVVLHTLSAEAPGPLLGQRAETLVAKGIGLQKPFRITRIKPGASLLVGAAYTASFSHEKLLNPRHRFAIPLRLDINHIAVGLTPIYGFEHRAFSAWRYHAHLAGGRVFGGYGWDIGPVRLGGDLGLLVAHIWQTYDTGDERQSWQVHPNGRLTLLWPIKIRAVLALLAEVGPTYLAGAGKDAGTGWHVSGSVGVALFFRLF